MSADQSGHIQIIEATIKRGDLDQARLLVKAKEDFLPANDREWVRLHKCLEKIGLPTQDELMTLRYLKVKPEASLPRINLALSHANRGRNSDAEEQLRIAIKTPVHVVDFWRIAGQVYAHFDRDDDAIDAYRKALDIAPDNFWVRIDYIGALCKAGLSTQAKSECPQVIEDAGENIIKCLRYVWIFERWGLIGFSRIGFERMLGIISECGEIQPWADALRWIKLAPKQIRTAKMDDIVRDRPKKKLSPEELAKVMELDVSQMWTERFLNIAITHLPEDRDLLFAVFQYALDVGNADALLILGKKLAKIDAHLAQVNSIVVELEEMAVKGMLPSKLWWDGLRNLQNARHSKRLS